MNLAEEWLALWGCNDQEIYRITEFWLGMFRKGNQPEDMRKFNTKDLLSALSILREKGVE